MTSVLPQEKPCPFVIFNNRVSRVSQVLDVSRSFKISSWFPTNSPAFHSFSSCIQYLLFLLFNVFSPELSLSRNFAIFVSSSTSFESAYRWNFGFTSTICIFIGRFGYPTRTCIFFNYVGGPRRKTHSLARKSWTTATFGPVKTLISSARLETPTTRRVHY